MKTLLILSFILGSLSAQAEVLLQLKDWTAHRNVVTATGQKGCVAETIQEVNVNGKKEKWVLQVARLQTPQGDHTYDMVYAFPEHQPTNEYYEALSYSNHQDTAQMSMTLLQPGNGDKTIVASRVRDRIQILSHIKRDSTFTVDFLTKEGPTRSVAFSLRGSAKTINKVQRTCE